MYAVGHISRRAERLIEVTYEALMRGVAAVKPGNTTGHIGAAIQNFAERERCSVVRDFCGHGLGRVFHDRPNILHYGEPGDGVMLEPGMLFTIEPMINLGKPHVKILTDGWTAVTRDRELSAQFEHTVGVTETGCEVFTISPGGLHKPPYRLDLRAAAAGGCAMGGGLKDRGAGPEQGSLFKVGTSQGPAIADIASVSRSASSTLGRRRCPTMSCWSSCCSAPFPGATPSRWPSG